MKNTVGSIVPKQHFSNVNFKQQNGRIGADYKYSQKSALCNKSTELNRLGIRQFDNTSHLN
jgi:hypothetical protein